MGTVLKARSEVEKSLTWDLSLIYETDEAMLSAMDRMEKLAEEIAEVYKGKLSDAETIIACLDEVAKVYEKICKIAAEGTWS